MPPLELQLKPSKTFSLLLLFVLSGAFISIFCSFLPYYIQLPLGGLTLVYGAHLIWEQVYLQGPRVLVALTYRSDQTWLLRERSGAEYPARLCGESTRSAWVSCLCFQASQKRRAVVFYDAVDPVSYRRLLMRLKYAVERNAQHS